MFFTDGEATNETQASQRLKVLKDYLKAKKGLSSKFEVIGFCKNHDADFLK